ncbi:MAG: tetratricopeptide repeat protein [Alphaproteobacteria bacterium]|nr:tetratricopeptide repeat protein [Alphaproteobacteria bacterium]MBL7099252.1 tetratricopeptide repeat protein [Alphaproteobacteria bacterium]
MASGTPGQPNFNLFSPNPAVALAQIDRLRQAGRMAEAEDACRRLVAENPNFPNALNMLGLFQKARGAFGEAEASMRQAIAVAPREAALHNNLGNILVAAQKPGEAEPAYRKAVELKPDYAEAFFNLGIVLRDLDRPEEALTAYRKATQLRPDYAAAQVQLGAVLSALGRSQEALGLLEAATRTRPSYEAHYYHGTALMDLERFDEAIPVLRSAVDLDTERYEARYAMSKCFAHVGNNEDALLALRTVYVCKPDFLPALYDYTALAFALGNGMNSLESYAYARSKLGDTPDLLLAEGEMRLRFTDTVGAERLLLDAANRAPERADIAAALGRLLTAQGRLHESLPHFQTAIAAAPDEIRYRREMAEALLRADEAAEARAVLREALTRDPHDQIALAYLSTALRELGDSDYDRLVDARFVREFEIATPPGFGDLASFNRALAEELERFHTTIQAPIDQTLMNGTQTAGTLFTKRSKGVEALREQIRAAVAAYIKGLPEDAAHPMLSRKSDEFSFAGSWSCRLRGSGYHTSHVHDQGWISSAYYVSLPEEVASGETDQGALQFAQSRFKLGRNDRVSRTVQPAAGKLVLFPSYFWHGTVPFESNNMRLTVAFDVTPGKPVRRPLFRAS